MKKRITQAEWEYIGKYNPAAKWLKPFALTLSQRLRMVSAESVKSVGPCIFFCLFLCICFKLCCVCGMAV